MPPTSLQLGVDLSVSPTGETLQAQTRSTAVPPYCSAAVLHSITAVHIVYFYVYMTFSST